MALSKRVTQGYWEKVREILHSHYRLSLAVALRGIQTYQAVLAQAKIGDEIYHAPVDETAKGIVEGGYATEGRPKKIRANSAPQTDQADSGWSIDEMLMDSRSKTPDTEMVESDDLKQVLVLLEKMDPREATVLRMRFGLNDEEPKTLKEIGECLGLTRERVRQIESEALAKLSESLTAE